MEIDQLIEMCHGTETATFTLYGVGETTISTQELCEAVEALKSENNRLRAELEQYEWVPVTERLPDKDGNYDVTYLVGRYERSYSDDRFENGHFNYFGRVVIAWRPLSKPYVPEEKK